eukprot:scaffold1850_cov194-Pinguiococcus_pyrenoidosus.AAC.42
MPHHRDDVHRCRLVVRAALGGWRHEHHVVQACQHAVGVADAQRDGSQGSRRRRLPQPQMSGTRGDHGHVFRGERRDARDRRAYAGQRHEELRLKRPGMQHELGGVLDDGEDHLGVRGERGGHKRLGTVAHLLADAPARLQVVQDEKPVGRGPLGHAGQLGDVAHAQRLDDAGRAVAAFREAHRAILDVAKCEMPTDGVHGVVAHACLPDTHNAYVVQGGVLHAKGMLHAQEHLPLVWRGCGLCSCTVWLGCRIQACRLVDRVDSRQLGRLRLERRREVVRWHVSGDVVRSHVSGPCRTV